MNDPTIRASIREAILDKIMKLIPWKKNNNKSTLCILYKGDFSPSKHTIRNLS